MTTDKIDNALGTLSEYAGSFITHWMDDDDPEDHARAVEAREEANDAEETMEAAIKAARAMLAALKGQLTLTEHYAFRLRNVHAIMAREMEMDMGPLRSAIAAAEAAGITAE